MKQGKTLTQLAAELERQQNSKRDFVADTRKLLLNEQNELMISGIGSHAVNVHASKQIADHCGIPQKYYDRMPADLRSTNVNYWFRKEPAKRMVRTLDGNARAFLSDRYRALDNFDLAEAIMPVLMDVPEMRVESCELTERRMYIKALFPRIQGELQKGDLVQAGLVISNSEIGQGSLRVEPLVYRLVCTNGLISNISQRKYHVGRQIEGQAEAFEIFRPETMAMSDKAFWMQVQDTVRAGVDQAKFNMIVREMQKTLDMPFEADAVTVIERAQKRFTWTDGEKGMVLNHLIQDGDTNAFGLMNAITRTAQDIDDYDRATEFERMGGNIIELKPSEWKTLAAAA